MVAAPDRALLTSFRSILARPGDEKRMPLPIRKRAVRHLGS
jgi:hypothetical protein